MKAITCLPTKLCFCFFTLHPHCVCVCLFVCVCVCVRALIFLNVKKEETIDVATKIKFLESLHFCKFRDKAQAGKPT